MRLLSSQHANHSATTHHADSLSGIPDFAEHVTVNSVNGTFSKPRLRWEIAIVLALSFGAAGVRGIVTIIERLTLDASLANQVATINRPLAERPLFDLTYQLLSIVFGLAPVALVVFLTWSSQRPHTRDLGFGRPAQARNSWWMRETGWGIMLAAIIGVPGLAFYALSRWAGINVTVVPTALDEYWWTVPVLVLAALRAALGEELIVVAYLFNRLRLLGMGTVAIIVSSALLRGSYHLYQGFGGFIGNVIMGVVFGWAYHRWGRSLPLIVAHWVLDIVSFVGYPIAVALWPTVFAVAG